VARLAKKSEKGTPFVLHFISWCLTSTNFPPSNLDLTDPKVKAQWEQDPDHFELGNLLDDPSKATLENVQQVRDIIRKTTKNLNSKPRAGSIESDHLTSFQNRMLFYDLLLSSWTENMLSIMSKYLENHDMMV
jgi:hypothetical protein